MLEHFKDYNDIVGDHPHEPRARRRWRSTPTCSPTRSATSAGSSNTSTPGGERMVDNGGIIPTNIGLDGKIGGACGGKWYGGVYGWGFTRRSIPATERLVHRNDHHLALNGFGNAYFLTGDDRFLDAWRKQIDAVNSHAKARRTAGRSTRTCTATRAGTTTGPSRTSTACSSSITGR